jgi:H+/gluconate symporter-like permease
MNSRSKTNNFIALLIAIALFAIVFALYFIHQNSESNKQTGLLEAPAAVVVLNTGNAWDYKLVLPISPTRTT